LAAAALLDWAAQVHGAVNQFCRFDHHLASHFPSEHTAQGFRREATNILRELKLHKNVGLAVSQIRLQGVPHHCQAAEFADLLTMALEETRGPARRVCVAFIGGLTRAFAVEQCILGLETFFHEIYEDLRIEVPDLSKRVASELLPTLKSLLEGEDFERVAALQVHCCSFKRWEPSL